MSQPVTYQPYEPENLEVREPAVAYNAMPSESDLWNPDDPEMQETIELAIKVGIEQVLQGKCHTADEVWNRIKTRHGWN